MRMQRVAVGLTVLNSLLVAVVAATALRPSATAGAASLPQVSEAVSGQAPILRGRALEIVDEHGSVRARLDVESDGEVILRMADRNGTIRVKFGAGEGGSGLLLLDEHTEPAVHIVARRTGTRARPTTTSVTLRAGGQHQVLKP